MNVRIRYRYFQVKFTHCPVVLRFACGFVQRQSTCAVETTLDISLLLSEVRTERALRGASPLPVVQNASETRILDNGGTPVSPARAMASSVGRSALLSPFFLPPPRLAGGPIAHTIYGLLSVPQSFSAVFSAFLPVFRFFYYIATSGGARTVRVDAHARRPPAGGSPCPACFSKW